MDIQEQQDQPFLENISSGLRKPRKTPKQKVIRKTFKGTTHLAKLLPTGSVLTFQILSPVLTHQGHCRTITSKYSSLTLLAACGLSCFLLCLTDSLRDAAGKVRYGMATFKGLWVIDGSHVELSEEDIRNYKLKFIDFVHGFMSMLVFAAVAAFDKNTLQCFCPTPTEELQEILTAFPIVIGVVCSMFFLVFPTKRHGIGNPLSKK